MLRHWVIVCAAIIVAAATLLPIHHGFQFAVPFSPSSSPSSSRIGRVQQECNIFTTSSSSSSLFMSDSSQKETAPGKISGAEILGSSSASAAAAAQEKETDDNDNDEEDVGQAATGTVNERLLLELQDAAEKEKSGGARSSLGKKLGLDSFRSRKTDEERQAAIDEARNLNGVNPLVTGVGSIFAIGVAVALWQATTSLGVFFATHPVATADSAIFVQRTAAVFRNVVVGLVSLSSGFFGVTGLGILLLTFRVAYGIFTGELDPTPIKKAPSAMAKVDNDLELPNALDLMLGKRPNRRRSKDDKDNFGL